jgi:glycosyltransferase 2 family protein
LKDRLVSLLKFGVSAGLLCVLFRTMDVRESWDALRGMNWGFFLIALLLLWLTKLIRAYRWRVLLDAVDVRVPVLRLTYLYVVGTFFNTFLPSGFGGDAVRMYELNRYSHRGPASVSTVLLERLIGLAMIFALGLAALPLIYADLPQPEALGLALICGAGLIGSFLLFQHRIIEPLLGFLPPKVKVKMTALYEVVYAARRTGALWQSLGISLLFSVVLFVINYMLALAVGIHVSMLHIMVFMPILSLSMTLPSVGALGTREGAYVLVFAIAGVAAPVALAISLAFYALNVAIGIVGGLLYAVDALLGMRAAPAVADEAPNSRQHEDN